jgi:hypothetical protein
MTIPVYMPMARKKQIPYATMAPNFDMARNLKEIHGDPTKIYEFIGMDDFVGVEWYQRIRFEVDAGRIEVPLLYTPIYDEVVDSTLPETLKIKNWGASGVIFDEVFEGGEVKFIGVTSSEAAVSQRQFGVGLEYDKRLIMFNQLWQLARMEREVGRAHNALLNHLHLSPILNFTYTGPNQTPANTTGGTPTEKLYLTLEDAIVASQSDTTNPRMGPYVLLVHPAKAFSLQRALTRVPQVGFKQDGNIEQFISAIVGYSGWTGTRGKKTVTYPGVTATKGYLINTVYRSEDFVSLVKQPLESAQGNADVSRFILNQIVWDVWLGVYSNPLRAVEEITFP